VSPALAHAVPDQPHSVTVCAQFDPALDRVLATPTEHLCAARNTVMASPGIPNQAPRQMRSNMPYGQGNR
jgi:hypothetical protein